MEGQSSTPILVPMEASAFWKQLRTIIQEELVKQQKSATGTKFQFETPGLVQKPLYKMNDVCALFKVTRPTIYHWVKEGKLKPYKIKSRVYFLYKDIEELIDFK